jgi:hypothetical protein
MSQIRIARTAAIVTALACISSGPAHTAGVEEFVAVNVYPQLRSLVYTSSDVEFTAFVGEPIEFVVTVHNNTRQAIEASEKLFDLASVSVAPRDRLDEVARAYRVAGPGAGLKKIDPSRRLESTFQLGPNSPKLLVGRYVVRAEIPQAALGLNRKATRDLLARETIFEVRESRTELDGWDQLLHLAYRAKLYRRPAEQQRHLEELLRRHPTSVAALADLGQIWHVQGDCARAKASWQRAVDILVGGGDPEMKISQISREDLVAGLRGSIHACGG